MALTFADKEAVVESVAEVVKKSQSIAAAKYSGCSVADMTALRSKARERGVQLKVVKNTLSRRAIKNTEHECLEPALTGPVFLAFSLNEPGAAARLLRDSAKENSKLEVAGVALGGKLYTIKDLDAVADLPTRDEALAKLLAVMKEPIAKFVRTLAAPNNKLVRTLTAIRDAKQ